MKIFGYDKAATPRMGCKWFPGPFAGARCAPPARGGGGSRQPFCTIAIIGFCCAISNFAWAQDAPDYQAPDYLTIGGGAYDFDKYNSNRRSVDYRVEYRWGASLLPMIDAGFDGVEPYMQIHPGLGFEGSSKGSTYPDAGLNLDIPFLWHQAIFTWGEAVGVFSRGNDARALGSPVEFRSQLELGWQFDDDVRVTGYISHLSNAHIAVSNPGAEIVGAYLHIPLYGQTAP